MVNQYIHFSKEDTTVIKGFAILFMIAHHCLIPEFYINPEPILSTRIAAHLMSLMKSCVSTFTFIVGYGYFYRRGSYISYFTKHTYNLLTRYWFVLFAISLPLVYICDRGGYLVDIQDIVFNLFGLKHGYCLGNWYVYFYIYSILLIPCVKWFVDKYAIVATSLLIITFGISSYFVQTFNIYLQALKECLHYTPLLVLGYYFAKDDIFSRFKYDSLKNWKFVCLFLFVSIIRFVKSSLFGISTDIIFVPFLFFVIIELKTLFNKLANTALSLLGNNSTFMWFIHCLFFSTATRVVFQSLAIWPKNLLLVYVSITIVSLLTAMLFNYLISLVDRKNISMPKQ